MSASVNPDALPQLIGDYKPVDEWQTHITRLFYGLRGNRVREFYQTFAAADYRLAHALAQDYYGRVQKREHGRRSDAQLTIHEWGVGNGNLAARFLSHLRELDREGRIYPRVRYVMVDSQEATLAAARQHPGLASHSDRVATLHGDVTAVLDAPDASVDRILCNELWNDLATKLMLRKGGDTEEEFVRPNLSETKHDAIADWHGFVRAFEQLDIAALSEFPAFLEDIVWEREYRKVEWKDVPYRKTIVEFLKQIDEEVLVPINLGAAATIKEAKRLLASNAVGFSAFDAGTADLNVLNDPDKPCYGQFGGQYSFMVNFAFLDAVAKHMGIAPMVEPQREFVGAALGTNVLTVMDVLATHPSVPSLKPWEQDRLIVKTLAALNHTYSSPYAAKLDFAVRDEVPREQRDELNAIVASLKENGVPDPVASYLSEEELHGAYAHLEAIGYDRDAIEGALRMPIGGIDYLHFQWSRT